MRETGGELGREEVAAALDHAVLKEGLAAALKWYRATIMRK